MTNTLGDKQAVRGIIMFERIQRYDDHGMELTSTVQAFWQQLAVGSPIQPIAPVFETAALVINVAEALKIGPSRRVLTPRLQASSCTSLWYASLSRKSE